MDPVIAKRMETELKGQTVAGWLIGERIGHGKSALVLRGSRDDERAAIKVFDRELIARFGAEKQRERVLREKALVGKHHANLIEILDAGEDTERDLFYVAMALIKGRNLDEARDDVPSERIQPLVGQVARAAHFLEQLGLAHRDIKPENIVVSEDFSTAVLLDLGVLRPIGQSDITDAEQQEFIATLRYGPPELLVRDEVDTLDGWRAVTFYQLGGVLHDLISKRPLFADDDTPYPRLVEAIRNKKPTVLASGGSPDLVLLASNCLIKSPVARLELVSWESFDREASREGDVGAARERIRKRQVATMGSAPSATPKLGAKRQLAAVAMQLEKDIRRSIDSAEFFPPRAYKSHDPTDQHVCVAAHFEKSADLAIGMKFSAVFLLGLVDTDSGAIQVSAGIRIGEIGQCFEKEIDGASIFQGEVDHTLLRRRIDDFLVLALDSVHQLSDDSLDEGWIHVAWEK